MAAPLIGITSYGRDEENWFRLPAEYVDAVRRAGGIAVLLPPGERRLDDWVSSVDALILTGGGDLHPDTYGGRQHESTYMVDRERDESELALALELVDSRKPGMCICRGMQVLNVVLGGTLIEHLPDEISERGGNGDRVAHRGPPRETIPHSVRIEAETHLAAVAGKLELDIVSWHHQAIRKLGDDLIVAARAPDGVIEAIEMPLHPWLVAVQWHPELSAARDATQQRLFDALVVAAARRR